MSMPSKQAIANILWAYRIQQGDSNGPLPLRELSETLTARLAPIGGSISHQSLSNWENQVHAPSGLSIMQIIHLANQLPYDWRSDLAQDLLAILKPDLFSPASPIGVKALKQLHQHTRKPKNTKSPPNRQPPRSPGAGG